MPPNTGRLNPGIEYQFKVIAYTAVCLCENKDVEDFLIYTNKEEVPGFDDIIAKVWYKSQPNPVVYLGQIKHRTNKINLNNKANNIKKYRDDMKEIFAKKATDPFLKALLEDVPEENVEFWFFCNNSVFNTKNNDPIIVDGIQYDVKPSKPYKSIFLFLKDEGCSKLTPNSTTIDSGDFDIFYLFLNQPDNNKINQYILKCDEETFTKETTTQIIAYTTEYLQTSIGSRGLRRYVFELHLLRLCLSPVTIPPTDVIEMYDDLASLWNKLNLEYDVTIIDQGAVDMKPYLFGIFYKVLKNKLNDSEFNWNSCLSNSNKLPEHFNFKQFVELTKRDKVHYWLSKPDVLDILLIEMWKCDYIPLILNPDFNISILRKYQHLKKKFIVMDNDYKISHEIHSSGLTVCANMADIRNDSIGRQLLEGINISLQGREPLKFADVVDNCKSVMSEIRCSHLLNLLKKISKIFVKKQCLEHGSSMVFIISYDSKSNKEISDDWKSSLAVSLKSTFQQENVIINCTSFEVEKHIRQVKNHPNLKNYSIYHLRRQFPNGRLEYSKGDILKIKHFLTDENGSEIYFQEGKLTPIIGSRQWNEEDEYLSRYLRKSTIQNSFLDLEEQRIIFLTGDVDSLEVKIKRKIIKEFSGDIEIQVDKCLKEKTSALVAVDNDSFDQYWSMDFSNQYPIFYIQVNNGALIMLRYRNYQNLYSYITYDVPKFEEEVFFEQITSGINIISGAAGLGKTALLHSLCEKYCKQNFVLFCDLVDYRNELKEGRKSELFKKPLKYILSRCEHSIPSNCFLPNGFFNSICEFHQKTNRLLLIIDSFDAVLRFNKKEVLELVNSVSKSNIRIIIACRPMAESVLINNFEVQPIQIQPLDKYAATTYLRSRKLKETDINRIPVEFLENPMYLKFQISLSKDMFLIGYPNNKFNLYKAVIEKQIERYCEKKRDAYNSPYQRKDILNVYKLLALTIPFGEHVIKDLGLNYDDLIQECVDTYRIHLGIIIRFNEDGLPIFAHHWLADFLVVLWIYENINTISAQKIYKRLLDGEQRNIRLFLDNYVCENLKLHQAILSENLQLVESLCEENKEYLQDMDEYNRTPLHLAASYCRERTEHCGISVQKIHAIRDVVKYKILDTIIRHMMEEKYDFSSRDLLMKWNWFEYIRENEIIFEILCRHGLSATLEKYLDLEERSIKENDIDNSLGRGYVQTALVLLKHNPSIIKRYFDEIVELSLKSNNLKPILHLIQLQNYKNEEFNIFSKICKNIQLSPTVRDYVCLRVNGEFTSLHLACMYGNLGIVKRLLNAKASSCRLDKFKNTPLHYSVMQGSVEIVATLIKHMPDRRSMGVKYLKLKTATSARVARKENMNIENDLGMTPLHIAAIKGNLDITHMLLQNGANMDSYNKKGNTPLYFATVFKHIRIFEMLVDNGANINAQNIYNDTVIHHAAQMGSVDTVNALLAKEVDVNIQNSKGNTALHNAVFYEQVHIIKLLIERGANTNIQNNSSNTALHTAIIGGRTDIVKIFIQSGMDINLMGHKRRTPLHMAAYNGHIDICRTLVDNNADIYVRDSYDDTVLHSAVQGSITDIIRILLQRKIDINLKGRNGDTSLHATVHFGHTEAFQMLFDSGADVNIRNDENHTVLDLASIKGKADILRILSGTRKEEKVNDRSNTTLAYNAIRYGKIEDIDLLFRKAADLILRNACKSTVTDDAVEMSKAEIIQILLKEGTGTDVKDQNDASHSTATLDILEKLIENEINISNITNNKNNTALHLAVIKEKHNMIKLLLKRDFDINFRGCHGNTPLCIAAYNGQVKILGILLENKADFTIRNDDNNTALHLAARKGKIDIVRVLLEQGMDVNAIGINGNTSLCLAAYHGHTETLRILFENGADFNIRNDNNDAALHLAARNGKTCVVELFLEKGMDVHLKGSSGNTSLHVAAENGQVDTLRTLLQNGADLNIRNMYNNTALHLSSLNGRSGIVEILLKRGMDVNLRDCNGNTALCLAADNAQTDTVRTLLQNGADFNIRNNYNNTALHLASRNGKADIIALLLKNGMDVNLKDYSGNTPLCLAACNGESDIVRALLENGANFNIENDSNDTALHLAAQKGKTGIVEMLLKNGMDINLKGCNGNTSLHWAACKGHTEMFETLLQSGADCTIRNDENNSVLHAGALNGRTDIVKTLLKKGIDINSQNSNGNTPLCLSACEGEAGTFRTLLENGADISIRNDEDDTALHIAAQYGKTNIIEILLKEGMDVNLLGSEGNTSFNLAACNGQIETLNSLIQNGADISIKNNRNDIALHLAARSGKPDVVEKLLEMGIDINSKGSDGNTSLCLAAYYGQAQILETLLQSGADISVRNENNDTALHLSAQRGNTEIVEKLLQRGMDVNLRGYDGNTVLCCAASEGQTEVMEALLQNKADIHAKNADNNTAIHLAACSGKTHIVVELLEKEVDVNLKGYNGNTVLCLAAYNGQTDTLKSLLQNGADISIKNDGNDTALDLATRYGKSDIIEILLKRGLGDGVTALNLAANNRRTDIEGKILQIGTDTGIQNEGSDTPLHLAVQYGKIDIVKVLLNKGSDVNSRGRDGNTSLCWAACKGQTETLETLLENGADINIRNDYHNTVLHLAALNGKTDIVEVLLKMGLDVNSRGYNGNTSLSLAAYSGQTKSVETLLHNNADTSIRNDDNDTVLHMAAQYGRTDIVEILSKQGIDLDLRGAHGDTPLCVAAYNGQAETLETLLQNGADSNIRNDDNESAINLAIKNGKTDVVEVLLKTKLMRRL